MKHVPLYMLLVLAAPMVVASVSANADVSEPQGQTTDAKRTTSTRRPIAPPAGSLTKDYQKKPQTLQTIVVTGSRAGTNRSALGSLAPIDVLTAKTLQSTGMPDLSSALRVLLPSLNFDQPTNVDVTSAVRPVQLRGLSPDETIVLINGKRAHASSTLGVDLETFASGSSGFDLNSIPMNAVARVEVLRDGAAAQYGSAAIAGVINIILKGGSGHGSEMVGYGDYANTRGGARWQDAADTGFALGSSNRGWMHVSVNYSHQDPTNWAGPDFRFPQDPTFGKVTFHSGLSKNLTKQLAANWQYDISPHAQVYGYWVYSRRVSSAFDFFRSLSTYSDAFPAAARVYPDGYSPDQRNTLIDSYAVTGVRGTTIGDWHYDVSVNYGFNHSKLNMSNSYNYSLASIMGASAPTDFYLGTTGLTEKSASANFTNTFRPTWLPHPLKIGWGVNYTQDVYSLKAGEPLSYFGSGTQGFAGFQPADAGAHSRESKSGFIDLSTEITDNLTAEVAARYAHYSDFGSAKPVNLSFRYQLPGSWAVRGTASTGFRAPSLAQQWYSSTATNTVTDPVTGNLVLTNIRHFQVTDPAAAALGAKPLLPEKSTNFTLGVVYAPDSGLTATFDLYQIFIRNRIVQSGFLTGPEIEKFLTSIGIPGVEGGAFFTNAVNTRTRGADLVVSYPWALNGGATLTITASANYGFTKITHVATPDVLPELPGAELPVLTLGSQANIVSNTPRSKGVLSAVWNDNRWTVTGRVTRYGKFGELYPTEFSEPQIFGARYVVDGSVGYKLNHWDFLLGANNLNDVRPDENNSGNSFFGIFPYPRNSPMDNNGLFYYGQVTYSW